MIETINGLVAAAPPYRPEPPRPLRRRLPPEEPFPADALGTVLGAAARGVQDRIQAPLAIGAQSVLAAATLTVQGHADVRLPFGQAKPLSNYYVSIADSGERKSATDSEALGPVRHFEAQLREHHRAALLTSENARATWEAERRRILQERKLEAGARRDALDELGPAPEPPLDPMRTCPEPTFEGLVRLFAVGWPSLGLFATEGGQLIGGHAMSQDHRLKTAAGFSGLWDGEPLRRVRAGDGSSVLPGRRLAIHLMVQPAIAGQFVADPLLISQGLLSRILPAAPDSTAGTRLWREPAPESEQALKRYGARLLDILEAPLPLREGARNELQPRVLELTPGARRLWIKFADHIERQQSTDGPLGGLRWFASKAAEHAARLAAVLTLVDALDAGSVDERHLAAGVELVQFYLAEWLRLHDAGETRPELLRAERLLAWLHADWSEPLIGLPEIYQRGPNALRTAREAREAVAVLEEHGWLHRVPEGAEVAGTFRRDVWRVAREALHAV